MNQVVTWMLIGGSGYDVTQAVVERFPDYPVGDVIAAAAAHFRSAGVADPAAIRGFCIEAYRELYRKSLTIGDLGTALKALARLERTAGG